MTDLSQKPDPVDLPAMAAAVKAERALLDTPWDALPIEQKLERIRSVVKEVEHSIQHFWRQLRELQASINLLEKHYHYDGKVVVSISDQRGGDAPGMGVSKKKVEGWF